MGSFTSQLGTSQLNSGLLDMQSVFEARKDEDDADEDDFEREVGGALHKGIKAFSKFMKRMRPRRLMKKDVDIDIDVDEDKGGKHRVSKSKLKKLLK
jgi:hypothetical protein